MPNCRAASAGVNAPAWTHISRRSSISAALLCAVTLIPYRS